MSSLDCEECKGNCIYFTNDYMDGEGSARLFKNTYQSYDTGVFDVADGSIKPLFTLVQKWPCSHVGDASSMVGSVSGDKNIYVVP